MLSRLGLKARPFSPRAKNTAFSRIRATVHAIARMGQEKRRYMNTEINEHKCGNSEALSANSRCFAATAAAQADTHEWDRRFTVAQSVNGFSLRSTGSGRTLGPVAKRAGSGGSDPGVVLGRQ